MTTGTPSPPSSPGHLPTGSHLPAGRESGSATSVPSHGAHLTHKGANSASWPHDMDTCPQGIGSKIGDFHKGQPTAGRQELPGHCHLGLNWNMPTRHKGCVCNHSIAPSQGFCFQLQGLCSGRGRRLKVPFIVPPHTHTLFLAVPCLLHGSVEKVSLPRVSLLQMRRFTISHPRPVGSEVEL